MYCPHISSQRFAQVIYDLLKDTTIRPDGKKSDSKTAAVCGSSLMLWSKPAVKHCSPWDLHVEMPWNRLLEKPLSQYVNYTGPPAGGLALEPAGTGQGGGGGVHFLIFLPDGLYK